MQTSGSRGAPRSWNTPSAIATCCPASPSRLKVSKLSWPLTCCPVLRFADDTRGGEAPSESGLAAFVDPRPQVVGRLVVDREDFRPRLGAAEPALRGDVGPGLLEPLHQR